MKHNKLAVILLAAAMTAPSLALADDDEDELEFDEAYLYFELNDTDGDLGIHGKVDGDSWKKVQIEAPNDRKLLRIKVKSSLKRQGMTELFFESAEPTFDELDPEVFFRRFPEGEYEWEGRTLDGQEIEGEVYLSHIIPAAPVVASVDGLTENPGFDEEDGEVEKVCWAITPGDGVTIEWRAVTMSHRAMWKGKNQPLLAGEDLRYGGEGQPERKFPLGIVGDINAIYYEFVAEIDETDYKMTAVIPPAENDENMSWTIPAEFLDLAEDGEVKFEIIVRVDADDDGDDVLPGNQSAVEDCFEFETD